MPIDLRSAMRAGKSKSDPGRKPQGVKKNGRSSNSSTSGSSSSSGGSAKGAARDERRKQPGTSAPQQRQGQCSGKRRAPEAERDDRRHQQGQRQGTSAGSRQQERHQHGASAGSGQRQQHRQQLSTRASGSQRHQGQKQERLPTVALQVRDSTRRALTNGASGRPVSGRHTDEEETIMVPLSLWLRVLNSVERAHLASRHATAIAAAASEGFQQEQQILESLYQDLARCRDV